jgi:hypothetical protein
MGYYIAEYISLITGVYEGCVSSTVKEALILLREANNFQEKC